jgi:DNA adenine methylase
MQVTTLPGRAITTMAGQLSPPLKWAGGKRWLLPHLEPIWRHHEGKRLVEPFVGGMAVALGLRPARALLNDSNPHIINFYRWLRRGLVPEIEMANERELYYRQRERFNLLVEQGEADGKEAASLFYYLNRTGFNGLCRFSKKGKFNVPFGKHSTINYVRDFTHYTPILAEWELRCGGFSELKLEQDDFVYADPPYDVEFTQYSAGGFSWTDQVRLAHWLAELSGAVVASNQATSRKQSQNGDLGFEIKILNAPRMISSSGDRTPAKEMLAIRNV